MSRSGKANIACVFVAMMMLLSGFAMTVGSMIVQGTVAATATEAPSVGELPGAPQSLAVDQGDGRLWIWWDHPISQGSELVKYYDIYRGESPDALDWLWKIDVGNSLFDDYEVTNGVTYYYGIRASSDVGMGPMSDIVSGTPSAIGTNPSVPQNVVAQNMVDTAKVTWTAPANPGTAPVRYYNIYRGLTPATINYFWAWDTVDVNTQEYVDYSAYSGFDYAYAVKAESIVGESAPSATASVHVGGTGTIPSAPENLIAAPMDGAVIMTWSMPTNPSYGGIIRFDIYRGDTSGGEGVAPIDNLPRNPDGSYWFLMYVDDTVTNDHMYWYNVKAVGSGGSSAASNEVFAVPSQVGVQPDAPYMFGIYSGNGQVLLNMAAIPFKVGYVVNITAVEVYRSTTPGTPGTLIATLQPDELYYWDNTTTNGVTYYYSTRAVWAGGASEFSTQMDATPSEAGLAPAAPDNLWANPDRTSVNLNIEGPLIPEPPYVLGYDIYRSESAGGASTLVDTVMSYAFPRGDLSWFDSSAVSTTTYFYTVRAIGFYGTSGPSNQVHAFSCFTGDAPHAPTGLSGSAVGNTAHLTWNFPSYLGTANYLYFDIYADYGTGEWTYTGDVIGYPGQSPSFDDILLDPGTYHYKVLATNNYGDSAFSDIVEVTVSGGSVPGAPTDLVAVPGNGHTSLDWTAPADPGSEPIDYYIVYQDGVDVSHPTSPTDWIGGLNNGQVYVFTVAAHNAVGTGPQSAPIDVTPRTTPGAPTNLVAIHGNGQADLSWQAPADTGGSDILYYIVYQNGIDIAHPTGTTYTATGLTNGVQYSFTVAAHNVAGTGPQSTAALVTPSTVPGPPINMNGAEGNTQVALSWNPPASNGGAPIDYYVVYQDNEPLPEHHPGLTATIISLTNGVQYSFSVAAHNIDGMGPQSVATVFTPRTVPSAPASLNAAPGNTQAVLTWPEPWNGGAPIDYYIVYQNGSPLPTHYTGLTATIAGLTNGVQYSFTVAAHNVAGEGAQSPAALVTPISVPGRPTGLNGSPGDGLVILTWNAPTDTGGSPILYYAVYQNGTDIAHPTGTTYIASGLTNGVMYEFRVAAYNANGEGPLSDAVGFVPRTVPDAPASLVATPGNGQATLTWTAPVFNGGSPVNYYLVYRNGVELPTHYQELTAIITGLTNGVDYTFTVAAHNVAGVSAPSPEAVVRPFAPEAPSAPRDLTAVSGNAYVQLAWLAPTSNGTSPLTGYAVFRGTSPGDINYLVDTVGPTVLAYNDTSVTNGQTYYYQVKAMNAVGGSPMSNTATGNPVGPSPPSAPRDPNGYGTPTYAVLNWSAPSSEGTTPILRYEVYRGPSAGSLSYIGEVSSGVLTYNDTTVVSNLTYYYKVRAINSIGPGPLSEPVVVTTTVQQGPSAPRNLVAEAGNGYVKLEWQVPSSQGSSPIAHYAIFRGTSPGAVTTLIGTVDVPTTEYNDTTVVNGNVYYYAVKATNAVGPSGPSNIVEANPAGPAVPGAPGNLVATGAVAQVNLTWSAATSVTPVTSYTIYRGLSEETIGTTPIGTVSGTTLAYVDASVTAGTPYYYKVKATNSAGTGPASESAHATPTATSPGAPQNVAATPGPGKVTVSWTAPSSTGGSPITGYKVYLQLDGGSRLLGNVSGSTLSYVDTTGTTGTTYTYYVVAVNAIGSGTASTTASAAPQSNTSTDNTMLYVGILIAIIVVIAIVALLMRKKK
jgi:titin